MRVVLLTALLLVLLPASAEAAFPGVNGRLAYTCPYAETTAICTVNPDGTAYRRLTTPVPDGTVDRRARGSNLRHACVRDTEPAWSADGRRIAFTRVRAPDGSSGCASAIVVMDAFGQGQTQLPGDGEWAERPSWSPDGTRIAYTCGYPVSVAQVCVMDADGANRRKLTMPPPQQDYPTHQSYAPAWSPDGTRIAFVAGRDAETFCRTDACEPGGARTIAIMNADGSGEYTFTPEGSGGQIGAPDWAPGGDALAYDYTAPGRACDPPQGYPCATPTVAARAPLPGPAPADPRLSAWPKPAHEWHSEPVWSPDGRRVALSALTPGAVVMVMEADGAGQRAICSGDSPDWQPAPAGGDPAPLPPSAEARAACPTPPPPDEGRPDGGGGGGGVSGGTVPGTGTVTTQPVSPPTVTPRHPRPAVRLTCSRRRCRLVVRGRLHRSLASCKGRVSLRVWAGRRIVLRGRTRVSRTCAYTRTFRFRAARLRGAKRVKVSVARREGGRALTSGTGSARRA